MLRELTIRNVLSYGPDTPPLKLGALTVLIGPNGAGKSNLVECLSVLTAAPRQLAASVKDSGGVHEWLWKGGRKTEGKIEAVLDYSQGKMPLRHGFIFGVHGERFELLDEWVEDEKPKAKTQTKPYFYYHHQRGHPVLNEMGEKERRLKREQLDPEQSVLAQIKDPERYPELSFLAQQYEAARFYREWSFGRRAALRRPQPTDQRTDYLAEGGENLALVLNKLRPRVRPRLLSALEALFPGIEDFNLQLEAGQAQLFLEENGRSTPATRLSDGTLRYLCLMAVLCHPEPPPLIVIDEPELGLHPDVLPEVARLLNEAAERTQVIVTTHSDVLVDTFTETPENVVVCERENGTTSLKRLEAEKLREWLKKYSLGQLWLRGEIGGKRW